MSVQRVDQGAAAVAASALPEQVDDTLRTRYRQLRVMLHSTGLAASYAFVAAKAAGKDDNLAKAYAEVAVALRQRLSTKGFLAPEDTSPRAVLAALGRLDVARYARASREAATVVSWLSRLADALHQQDAATPAATPEEAP